jgi:hypothetical protein
MEDMLNKLKKWLLERLNRFIVDARGLTSTVFKSTIILLFTIIAFIGLFISIIVISMKILEAYNSKESIIATGYNYFYIPLILLIGFCRWQYESLKSDLGYVPKPSKTALIIMGASFIPAILAFFSNFLSVYFGVSGLGRGIGMTTPGAESSFLTAVLDSIYQAGLVYGLVLGIIIVVFRLGIFTSGLSISIALHNYLNGQKFDLSIFWDLLDLSLSDFWGAVFTIGNLLITYLIGRKLHISE